MGQGQDETSDFFFALSVVSSSSNVTWKLSEEQSRVLLSAFSVQNVHFADAGSSDCAFPVTLARVGCFDKQTLSVAGAACTNSREALERSDSKCLGTVVVFQSPCSPAVNTPPHTPAPPLLVKFCVILAAPELLRMLQLRRFNTLPAPARTKLAHAHSVSRLIKTCADLSH